MAYIDREDFCENRCKCNKNGCNKSECAIWRAPTADVEEVKHGEWKEAEGGLFYCCTNCGYIVEYQLTSGCPNCRAKMDGGKEEC